jgi:hypothetical protein
MPNELETIPNGHIGIKPNGHKLYQIIPNYTKFCIMIQYGLYD